MKINAWQQTRIFKGKIKDTFYPLLGFLYLQVGNIVIFHCEDKSEYNPYCFPNFCLHRDSPRKALGSKDLKDAVLCPLCVCSTMDLIIFFPGLSFIFPKNDVSHLTEVVALPSI